MSVKFQVNTGSGLAVIGTSISPPDPQDAQWFDEGQKYLTDSGQMVTFERSGIKLVWQNMSVAQFGALMSWWKSLSTMRFKLTQVRVPAENGYAWTTFSRYNNRGIRVGKPTGGAQGPLVPTCEMTLYEIKRSID
jgi:hypothetical protein